VTRWPPRLLPPSIEPPEWYRVFHEQTWAEPDEQELRMGDLPDGYRRWHRERRWYAARRDWCLQHPEYDWLAELQLRFATRRAAG
jgi:hypothetical protein